MTKEKCKCPLCGIEAIEKDVPNGRDKCFQCENCDNFIITEEAYETIKGKKITDEYLVLIRYFLYKMQKNNSKSITILNTEKIEQILKQDFPSISGQADSLILWLGEQNPVKEFERLIVDAEKLVGIVGSKSINIFKEVVRGLVSEGLIDVVGQYGYKLSFKGWRKYEELLMGNVKGDYAFMAMPFSKENEINDIYFNFFKDAVKETGFELRRLDEKPEAGLIDNRLRNEIKRCRFLVSDLTDKNEGAYWEAGFAEGLGKPVIYTCKKGVRPHFDTNHHTTVFWEKDKIEEALEVLKATIRFTIPEAKQTDD